MYLHEEGKVAEYQVGSIDEDVLWRTSGLSGFDLCIGRYDALLIESKEEALLGAMDYHEAEGCALYLELYPAPEKGEWNWLAQDGDGCWYGYKSKPVAGHNSWTIQDFSSYKLICESPSNPFWRKTLR